jgi:hypothetical protein
LGVLVPQPTAAARLNKRAVCAVRALDISWVIRALSFDETHCAAGERLAGWAAVI